MKYLMSAGTDFYYSDTPRGEDDLNADRLHRLDISFYFDVSVDYHPYGSTYAREEHREILDQGYEILLDEERISRVEFETRFGTEWARDLIKRLEETVE